TRVLFHRKTMALGQGEHEMVGVVELQGEGLPVDRGQRGVGGRVVPVRFGTHASGLECLKDKPPSAAPERTTVVMTLCCSAIWRMSIPSHHQTEAEIGFPPVPGKDAFCHRSLLLRRQNRP